MGMETWSEASHTFPPCQSRAGSPGAQEFWAGRAHACGRAADLGLWIVHGCETEGKQGLLQPWWGSGVSSRARPFVLQTLSPTLGLIIWGEELTWEHESRIKRLTATCEKIPSLVNFEFTWNWNSSLDFSIGIDCRAFPVNSLWWAAGQSRLAFLHGWAPGSHGPTSVRDWRPQKAASLCPERLELTCQHSLTFGLNKFEMCLKCSRM